MPAEDVERTNVRVMVRVRPFTPIELAKYQQPDAATTEVAAAGVPVPEAGPRSVIAMDGETVSVLDPEQGYAERDAFQFDTCFWSIHPSQCMSFLPSENPFADQCDVFDVTGRPAVESALRGFHNTIFAYGQTGSGKTYTMLGSDSNEGIAPRLVRDLFDRIQHDKSRVRDRIQYTVELSFMEIYNERVKDLLMKARGDEYAECRVRQHPEKGTFVEGLMRLKIESEAQCLTAIKDGMTHRATAATNMNATSSRSHAIFQICLTQKSALRGTTRVSTINLVDLAGSERIKMSGVTGSALQEAKNINLSLSTLRRVIDVLIDNSKLKRGQRPAVPPFREALLTWVLSDSLGGNSKTVMMANVSPFAMNLEDTLGTLRYALKAKAIVCNAKVNEEKSAAVVNKLRDEMDELRRQLEEKTTAGQAEQQQLREALTGREEELRSVQEETHRLDNVRQQYEEELATKADELAAAQEQITALDNVEEEKRQKEKEVERARSLQAKTAALLATQEAERKRKDAELEEVLKRKESLRAHRAQAQESEARAKAEVEQARTRQFVTAFQNAFLLGKHRTGVRERREENEQLQERLAQLESQVTGQQAELDKAVEEKTTAKRQVEILDRKCEALRVELEGVLQSKRQKIAELTTRKNSVDDDLERCVATVASRRAELRGVREAYAEEQQRFEEEVDDLETREAQLHREAKRKAQRLEELQAMMADAKERTAAMTADAAASRQRMTEVRGETQRREHALRSLRQEREAKEAGREAAVAECEDKLTMLATLRGDVAAAEDEVDVLRRNHAELRRFVSDKFFPTAQRRVPQGDGAPESQPMSNGPAVRVYTRSGAKYVDPGAPASRARSPGVSTH